MSNELFASPIDMLLDENNTSNIVLYNDDNEAVEFEQIALIPMDGKVYVILKPVNMPEIAEDEALVFVIDEIDDEDCLLVESDEAKVDAVFAQYYEMLREEGVTE